MARLDSLRWHEVSAMLDEMLEMDPVQLHARLADLKLGDPVLAEQVVKLLERQDLVAVADFLEGSALDVLGGGALSWAGRTIGNYAIERPIGHGGMGNVWLARRSDGRYEGSVAIKFLNIALIGTSGGAERFQREGNALAKLAHPNIPTLLDAGVASGQPYLVMEYVQGQSIDQYCDVHGCDIPARLGLFLQVAAAVSHAHRSLILHCDLKPSNILVTADGTVQLLDFGIARLLQDEASGVAALDKTVFSSLAFSPEFAAPEQLLKAEVTTATDVYGLGVLLYVLLTGTHPIARDTGGQADRLRALVEREPLRASAAVQAVPHGASTRAASSSQLARLLRGDLDNILAKALSKDAAERYHSVDAFVADLQRYLQHEPVHARAHSFAYRTGRLVQRHWLGLATTSLIMVALSAGILATAWQAKHAQRQRDEALLQSDLATAGKDLMVLVLQASSASGQPITQRGVLDMSVQLVNQLYARQPGVAVHLLPNIGQQYALIGDTAQHLALTGRAMKLAQGSGQSRLIQVAACEAASAQIKYGEPAQARAHLKLAMAAISRQDNPELVSVMDCMQVEAQVLLEEGNPALAMSRLQSVLQQLKAADMVGGGSYGIALALLVRMHESQGQLHEAFELIEQLRSRQENIGRAGTTNYFANRRAQAQLLMAWGEYGEAQNIISDIAPKVQNAGGAGVPPLWLMISQGALEWRLGNLSAAERYLRLAVQRSRAQTSHVFMQPAELALVQVLIDLKRFAEAETMLAEAALRRSHRADRLVVLATLRAQLLSGKGDPAGAAQLLTAEIGPTGADVRPNAALCLAKRLDARLQMALSNNPAAVLSAEKAVSMCERAARLPQHSADVGEAMLVLAQAQRRAGAGRETVSMVARQALQALKHGLGSKHRLTHEAAALVADQSTQRPVHDLAALAQK